MHDHTTDRRRLGMTDIHVSPVTLGCWPIAGMTSLNVNESDSLETIAACFDVGINSFDTAYCYGANGESERMIGRVIAGRRDNVVIATKAGVHWAPSGERNIDASPATIRAEFEQSLRRLNTDRVELLYLHAPDPKTPIVESASELRRIFDEGKARAIGASNLTLQQIQTFHATCPLSAVQPPYNMLQRDIEQDILPWCREHQVSVMPYWPLMKGLLAGALQRNHRFDPRDGRAKYPMFQGDEWQKNQDFVDSLRHIADLTGKSVTQVVINWTIHQPGITSALCGAKRPAQIVDSAKAMGWRLSAEHLAIINAALDKRGTTVTRWAV